MTRDELTGLVETYFARVVRHGDLLSVSTPAGRHELALVDRKGTRLDEGRARDAGGMGLGLAVVKSAVERHSGTVTVEDAEPHGARFVVRIPAA